MYLAVKTSGAQQCLVQNVHAVGGGQDDNAAVGAETVHLGQQLVQCVLAFVVAAHSGCFGTGTPYSVNLVDEHDTRRFFLCLAEQIADTGSSHADKHFHKVGTCQREERYVGFSGHGLCKQGLSGSRRAYQQGALGYLTSQIGIFLGLFQELDNFFYLLLGFSKSCHILECNLDGGTFFKQLGLGLSYAEDASTSAHASTTAHAAGHENPETDKECKGENLPQNGTEVVPLFFVVNGAVKVGVVSFLLQEIT